jgi:hypothetical protein
VPELLAQLPDVALDARRISLEREDLGAATRVELLELGQLDRLLAGACSLEARFKIVEDSIRVVLPALAAYCPRCPNGVQSLNAVVNLPPSAAAAPPGGP